LRRSTLGRRCWRTTNAKLEQPTTPKPPALKARACDDAARKAAAATDDKPARSWTKHTIRQTNTSYRLTLELSGGEAVRLDDGLGLNCTLERERVRLQLHRLPVVRGVYAHAQLAVQSSLLFLELPSHAVFDDVVAHCYRASR
jgi:hypothetical protein